MRTVTMFDRRIVGPAEHFHGVGRERSAELQRVAVRHDELGELDDDGDACWLACPERRRRAGGSAR
jgi:hypothetical protein